MPTDVLAEELIARARAGDQRAADELFNRFARRLGRLAATRLDRLVRRRVDPEDVVQSAYRSFFTRLSDGQFALSQWDEIWGLLARITVRKCGRKSEQAHAARRDAAREVSFSSSSDDSCAAWQPTARNPTPEEAMVLAETVESLLAGFDAQEQEIVGLRLQAFTEREISEQVGRSERTVRRVLERLRRRVERLNEQR